MRTLQSTLGQPDLRREWRFLQLTLAIAAWMLLSPVMSDRWIVQALLQAFLLNSTLVTLWANPQWRNGRRAAVCLWIASLAGSLLAILPPSEHWLRWARFAAIASLLPLLGLLGIGILGFVFRGRRLTIDGIFATIVVYLLVALMYTQLYLLLATNPNSFSLPVAAAERSAHLLQSDMLYFSLVTLATVGYGDVLPRAEVARMLAMLEAVTGQFYVAVVVAVFVGLFTTQRPARPG
jgi:voltage-gated potassium channel Kch